MRTHGKVSCALLAQGIWAGMRVVSLPVKCNPRRTVMKPLYRRIAGLDVHRMLYVLTVLNELDDGTVTKHQRSFGGFQRDLRDLVAWLLELGVELGVMESTGIYWKNVYAALEQAGIPAHVVNARHVKNVPGRKTDISDSEWLAQLGRFGLVRPSFIPPKDLRELRLVSRYRQKLAQTLAGEKNRLHKLLDDAGIKLGAVVSDIDGVSARAMIEGLIEGKPIAQLPELAKGALRTKRDTLERALEGELSPRHRLVLQQIQGHIRYLEIELANLDTYLIDAMAPYADYWQLLQTLPGIDQISAAMILVEIGTDLTVFSDADHFASWAALCPGNHESAGKRKTGKTRKGNHAIRYLLCEAANAARRTHSALRDKYQSLVPRKGHKKAIIAVAHKMVRTIFIVFTRRKAYRDPGIDYQAIVVSKNAPRWIQALKKYGYWPKSASVQTPAPAPTH
jgi:transposase